MSNNTDDQKRSFGKIAQLYDDGRPDYPAEIYGKALAALNRSVPLRILEIGCGTGKGTRLFARDSNHLLAIDISAELIDVAQKYFTDFQSIQFQVSSFEALDIPEASIDLIISAQAFHWVDRELRCRKAAYLLAAGGGIALFWNIFQLEATPLLRQIRDICLTHVPTFANWVDSSAARLEQMKLDWKNEVDASGFFEPANLDMFSRTLSYTPDQLIRLFTTYSWFQTQSEVTQTTLLNDLRTTLADSAMPIPVLVQTLLITALKKPIAS